MSKNSTIKRLEKECYNTNNDKAVIPSYFYDINKVIFEHESPDTDIEKAMYIALWLKKHIKGGKGLSLASDEALKEMINGNGGVCSDMTQIFNNFCVINDIRVREWGITIIPFNKKYGGHATNEVFSKELDKWILIDVSKCILFYYKNKEKPLSLFEVFTSSFSKEYYSFYKTIESDTQIKNYYYNKKATPFLISKYNNFVYDKYLKKNNSKYPIFFVHFYIYLIGKSYNYKFPLRDYRKMFKSSFS
ncbi:transglutaminase domain-containing protein [Winogradskyella sp.]|uniref:transglutaminase domain-containing protein n=1 Tax=Winogradskyella sp. TaxID=1883156 RepID=UPI0025ED7038|nr:transglutaminase domain-containing protein [Winogradskyella sp.]MCT4628403.1 transglutaminase-like domain-containing protein [Winogradskyella sp.]